MEIRTYNMDELVKSAKQELSQLELNQQLDENSLAQITTFLESYLLVQNTHHYSNRQSMGIVIDKVPEELFQKYSQILQNLHVSSSDMINILMQHVIENESVENISSELTNYFPLPPEAKISHLNEVIVSAEDLEQISGNIAISHVGRVVISDDVKEIPFLQKIYKITHCDMVNLPASFSKIGCLSKIRFCSQIEFSV
ncbi:hypothetical protein NEF87_000651 [Candidatus Lokiarchaeum ossiferum]|uniref:Uncharacterized protein n=1 Tax=Candidatus Lokiarchaeum ossiferum TaxID=2951803 RepID=A0ABY6HLH4_9ARCH|nr:hypothetical protein NEF87_000651 [Candidatus Lokiarchaeum sp. B-35]